METKSFADDFRNYQAILWRWAWLLILLAVTFSVSAYILSKRTTPVYEASATLWVNEAPVISKTDLNSLQTSERLARTYSELMTKKPVLDGVIDRLDLNLDVNRLISMIKVQPVRDTQLIALRVEDTDPVQAALIANTLGIIFAEQNQALQASRYQDSEQNIEAQLAQFAQQIQETSDALAKLSKNGADQAERDRLETVLVQHRQTYALLLQSYGEVRLAEAQSTSSVILAEAATTPLLPVRPRTLENTALAFVVGLLLAVGLVFFFEALDETIRGPGDISRELGLPVIGLITRFNSESKLPISASEPRSPVSDSFRALRTNIQFSSLYRPLRTILVTSPSPNEGKSTVATNLAVVLAQSDQKVILLDADLRRPKTHSALELTNQVGLSELFLHLSTNLSDKPNLNGHLQECGIHNLKVLTSGKPPPNPAELLGSELMDEVVHLVSQEANIIVIDSSPVLSVTAPTVVAPRVDGVLLVVKPGMTKLAAAKGAVEQLNLVGANIIGVVLNDIDFQRRKYDTYRYRGYFHNNYGHYSEKNSNSKINHIATKIRARISWARIGGARKRSK